jgi:hypothetical protein
LSFFLDGSFADLAAKRAASAASVAAGEAACVALFEDVDFNVLGGSSAPLGKNTDLHSVSVPFALPMLGPDGLKLERQVSRWQARSGGREMLRARGLHRLRPASCGFAMAHGAAGVEVYRRPDQARARLSGVCQCGQPLLCPVCSPRVAAERAEEVADGFRRASSKGWQSTLMVFTAPHKSGSSLLEEVDFWRNAWDKFLSAGWASQKLKRQRLGHVGGPEITWGVLNGWHFHRNLIIYHLGDLDIEAHRRRWMDCLGKRYSKHAEIHAFSASSMDSEGMARYCAKQGAEIAWQEGKSSSQTPLSLLVQAVKAGTDCPQWVEACTVVSVRKLSIVRWSRGLRKDLGMTAEKSDAEIAKEAAEPTDELLGVLTPAQWHRIIKMRLEYRLTQEAQLGAEALDLFLTAHGIGGLYSHEHLHGAFNINGNFLQ